MVRRKRILSFLMGVLIPVAAIVWFYSRVVTLKGPSVGDEIPSFTLPALAGGRVPLSDLDERTLLVFLSSECPSCVEELNSLDSLEEVIVSKLVRVIVVFDGGYQETAALFDEYPGYGQIAYDGKQVSRKLGIRATPAFLFVKENGILLQTKYGYLNRRALLRLVSVY